MRIEIFSSFSSELEKIWQNFEDEAVDSPFQSYVWLNHWQNNVGGPLLSIVPQIVIVWNEKETMAVFPMGIREFQGCSILEWLGGEHTDYMGPLLSKSWKRMGKDFQFCWNNIIDKLDHFDVIHFKKQKEYFAEMYNPLLSILKNKKYLYSSQSELEKSWDVFYAKHTNSKTRQTDRRKLRKLSGLGRVSLKIAENKVVKYKIIEKMMQQKSRRYNDTGVWDMLSVPEHKVFYEKLVEITDDYIRIHCAALIVGDVFVATHVGFVDKSTFYYLMPAHEGGDWERYSPGRLLLEHLIEWAIQDDLKVFDFTVGGDNYKKDWCDTETPLFEILEAVTFKGKIYVIAQNIKQTLKQMPWLGEKARQFNVWKKNRK